MKQLTLITCHQYTAPLLKIARHTLQSIELSVSFRYYTYQDRRVLKIRTDNEQLLRVLNDV